MGDRKDAWDAVHEALPARWSVGQASVSDPHTRHWSVTARGPHPRRGKAPQTVSGRGPTPEAALRDLDDRLRGVPKPHGSAQEALIRRLRLAWVQGAEEAAQERLGRGLTESELDDVMERFPTWRPNG